MPKKGKSAPRDVAAPAAITVAAQQSRFHVDLVDPGAVPASSDVAVKDLSVAVGAKEILARADLTLQSGLNYVLAGRNGAGKSTLLKAIADGLVPGIPWSLRILLLGQTRVQVEDDLPSLQLGEAPETVLQHVVRSNEPRERLVREADVLSAALEDQNDPLAPVKARREVTHRRLEKRVDEARQIAARRSGARGLKARKLLIQLEEEVGRSRQRLGVEVSPEELAEETQNVVDLLADVQSSLEAMDAPAAEAHARAVLLGLGFSAESLEMPRSNLSGGWKTRCDLASALCQPTDILLLDEPTNFLDLPSIMWLQDYLGGLIDTTVVVVTHDRDFADAVANELIVLRNQSLERFRGNLSNYERERRKYAKWMTRMKEAQDRQKKHMEASVDNSVKAAKRTGDDKKLKQAASRRKKLDERMGLEVSAKGTRFKLNRDMAGWHTSARDEIEVPQFDPPVHISIPTSPSDLRFPGALVSIEKVSFAYPAKRKSEQVPILRDVDLTIHPGERIGLAGLNGSGKTTLVSLIVGAGDDGASSASSPGALRPTSGSTTRHSRARFGRFSQSAVEELDTLSKQNPELVPLRHLMEVSRGSLLEKEARVLLSSLGLQGQTASDVPIGALSGGQKVRLALAEVLWSPSHLLILDEVTTHLDADTILGLVAALRGYEGALLVVTHDRFFMRCVVEGKSPSKCRGGTGGDEDEDGESSDGEGGDGANVKGRRVYRLTKGRLQLLEGGMARYEEIAATAAGKHKKSQ